MGKKTGKKKVSPSWLQRLTEAEMTWTYLTGSEEDRALITAERARRQERSQPSSAPDSPTRRETPLPSPEVGAGKTPDATGCFLSCFADARMQSLSGVSDACLLFRENGRGSLKASQDARRLATASYEDNRLVTCGACREGESNSESSDEVVRSLTGPSLLEGEGKACKAAPTQTAIDQEGRVVAEGSAGEKKKADLSRLVVASRPSEDSKSQEPLRDPAEHVPGGDVLIGSRPEGKKNVEAKIQPAVMTNCLDLRGLQEYLAPLERFLQEYSDLRKRVEELGATAAAPVKALMDFVQRLGQEAPEMIDAGVQVSPSRVVEHKGTQCEPAPQIKSSACQSTVCPTKDCGTMTEGLEKGVNGLGHAYDVAVRSRTSLQLPAGPMCGVMSVTGDPGKAPIVPVQLNSAVHRSETVLMIPAPSKRKETGVQTVKRLSSFHGEPQAEHKPQIKREIPKRKGGSPDIMEREAESSKAAVKPSLAEEGPATTLTEFPRCFWSRRGKQPGGLRRCYNCRRPGHEWRHCPRGDRRYTVPPRFAQGQGQRRQGPGDATSLAGLDAPPQKSSLRGGNCGGLPASRAGPHPQAARRSSPDSRIVPRGPAGPYGLCSLYTQPCWIPWGPPGVAVGGLMGSVMPYDPGVRHGHVTGRNVVLPG